VEAILRACAAWGRAAFAVLRDDATGYAVADPANRLLVNVGSASVAPADRLGSGQAHRRLLLPGRRGAAVVLRGRESRPDGKGGSERVARSDGGRR
jgi:hypothetical protein